MTKDELRKIFEDAREEFKTSLDLTALTKEFDKKLGAMSSSKEKGALIGDVLAVMFELNKEYLFRVLAKALCKQ